MIKINFITANQLQQNETFPTIFFGEKLSTTYLYILRFFPHYIDSNPVQRFGIKNEME